MRWDQALITTIEYVYILSLALSQPLPASMYQACIFRCTLAAYHYEILTEHVLAISSKLGINRKWHIACHAPVR